MSEFLKCDADGCGYIEDVDQITVDHVGKPCPTCGASLLTQEDWEKWKPIKAMLSALESAIKAQSGREGADLVRVGVHNNKTTIEIDRSGGRSEDPNGPR